MTQIIPICWAPYIATWEKGKRGRNGQKKKGRGKRKGRKTRERGTYIFQHFLQGTAVNGR